MSGVDKVFDINVVLLTAYASLEEIISAKNIELIYDMDPTVPKELQGNETALTKLISQLLTFVFKNSEQKEILFSLHAPKDFLYKESISFEIKETGIVQEKIVNFFETQLKQSLEVLNAEVIYEQNDPSAIHINIPFKISELGNRRHYRLPDIGMLGKKVLLICRSDKEAESLKQMFKYFLYDVDIGMEAYKAHGNNLSQYDLFIIEDKLATHGLESLVGKIQADTTLKYVLLHNGNDSETRTSSLKSEKLIKPVVQETVYDLIQTLFKNDTHNRIIKSTTSESSIDIEEHINDRKREDKVRSETAQRGMTKHTAYTQTEDENNISDIVFNPVLGMSNLKRTNSDYPEALREFLDTFDQSDKYFRDIVHSKSVWQIKEFCIDLEKHARHIGALSTADIAARVSLVFVYDQLDTLPIYIGKYHMELEKLTKEIKVYLEVQS